MYDTVKVLPGFTPAMSKLPFKSVMPPFFWPFTVTVIEAPMMGSPLVSSTTPLQAFCCCTMATGIAVVAIEGLTFAPSNARANNVLFLLRFKYVITLDFSSLLCF